MQHQVQVSVAVEVGHADAATIFDSIGPAEVSDTREARFAASMEECVSLISVQRGLGRDETVNESAFGLTSTDVLDKDRSQISGVLA